MWRAAVLTVSDRCSQGLRTDETGPQVRDALRSAGYEVIACDLVPDERPAIERQLRLRSESDDCALIVTNGGTGFSCRDVTPEATLAVCERRADGIPEAMRAASMRITPRAMLSRAAAGIHGQTLIVNLPGSPKGAIENLLAVLPTLAHGIQMLRGGTADCAAETTEASHEGRVRARD